MLPFDVCRCAGKLPDSNDDCPRRNNCARYLAPGGPRSPMAWSACEQGDGFIHAATVSQSGGADHPAEASSGRVLEGNALRTGGALATKGEP